MKSVLEVISLSADYLQKKGVVNSRRQAEEILCDALGCSRVSLYADFDRPLTEDELELCRGRLYRRGQGEPAAYIHGETFFFGCRILVNRTVLIPRQETEVLVSKIVEELEGADLSGKVLWDICCGSGCIGIALKKRLPALSVVLSDISPQALETAKKNAEINEVGASFREGDLLAPFSGEKADYIVCNPPYVSEAEFAALDREVAGFEPRLALVPGPSGLEAYRRLAEGLGGSMNPGGKAWLEIGAGQSTDVKNIFNGYKAQHEKDWSGNDRFFFLEF